MVIQFPKAKKEPPILPEPKKMSIAQLALELALIARQRWIQMRKRENEDNQ